MLIDQNKEVLRRVFADVISAGNPAAIDELVSPDFVSHNLRPGQPQGFAGFKQGLEALRASFPDWRASVEEMIGEGDRIAARWTVSGTHRGPFLGVPPTGRVITMKEIGLFRIAEGKLLEFWGLADEVALLVQLGVIPPLGGPPPPLDAT